MFNDPVYIVGGHGKDRHKNDFYPTPEECIFSLFDFLKIPKSFRIWDPCCGDGAILKALNFLGYENYFGTDIISGEDFLTCNRADYDYIITNPPFNLATEFIIHANELGKPFAFLLKCQFWNSSRRRSLFLQTNPFFVLPLTWRPDFTGEKSSLLDMCFTIWDPSVKHMRGETRYYPLRKITRKDLQI